MKKWDDIISDMDHLRRIELELIRAKARMVSELIQNREARGWTQKQLGDAAGMKQSAIARFEGGTTAPSIETILKIAIALGLQVHFTGAQMGLEEAAATSIEEEVYV